MKMKGRMMMTKIYIISRIIHRILVVIIVISTIIMTLTGIVLKFNSLSDLLKIDLTMIRFIHNNFSIVFSIILFFMILTGLIMYIYPILRKK